MRCHHESDRYENMMDLTLEIFGWVEPLEGALTQFTSPEDLDGENMYRCRRFVYFLFIHSSGPTFFYKNIKKNSLIIYYFILKVCY